MRLVYLAAHRFRNLAPIEVATDASFVVVSGANAQGKTNLLEAIYLLATLRSLRARKNRELIAWNESTAALGCRVVSRQIAHRFRVHLTPSGREVRLDGKKPAQLEDYFAGIRAIAFTPQDAAIVLGAPQLRRNWVDRAAFTKSPGHLSLVREVRRILSHKGVVLRATYIDKDVLNALDDQLAQAGGRLIARRVAMLEELQPHVDALYKGMAGPKKTIQLIYQHGRFSSNPIEATRQLRSQLEQSRQGELRRRGTLAGPQRHDVSLTMNGHDARTYASRGQIRSLVLAIKLAELVAARNRGDIPLFLLDDLSSELDKHRTDKLVGLLKNLGAQVFITTTDPSHLNQLPKTDTLFMLLEQGQFVPTS